MVDIDNPANYRNCKKKQYEIWVCKPPIGTVVFNRLEHAKAILQLKQLNLKGLVGDTENYTWFKPPVNGGSTLIEVKAYNKVVSFVNQTKLGYVINERQPFVLCGLMGEKWAIDPVKFASTYLFSGGKALIATDDINIEVRSDLQGNMPWHKVKTRSNVGYTTMACFLPVSQEMQIQTSWGDTLFANDPKSSISHGKGDFIVCDKLPDGQPDLNNRWVVNGQIFGLTYDNRGWSDCLIGEPQCITNIRRPTELFSPVFDEEFDSLYKRLVKESDNMQNMQVF